MGTSKPFPLTGTATLKKAGNNTLYDIKAQLSGDLKTLHFASTAMLAKQDGKFVIYKEAQQISKTQDKITPAASIAVNGQLGLTNDYPLSIKADITELHPERLGNYPAAKLNVEVNVQGKLLPTALVNLQFVTHDSQWQGQALASSGSLLIEDTQIGNVDFQAAIANNIIVDRGSLGKPDSRLEWQ